MDENPFRPTDLPMAEVRGANDPTSPEPASRPTWPDWLARLKRVEGVALGLLVAMSAYLFVAQLREYGASRLPPRFFVAFAGRSLLFPALAWAAFRIARGVRDGEPRVLRWQLAMSGLCTLRALLIQLTEIGAVIDYARLGLFTFIAPVILAFLGGLAHACVFVLLIGRGDRAAGATATPTRGPAAPWGLAVPVGLLLACGSTLTADWAWLGAGFAVVGML